MTSKYRGLWSDFLICHISQGGVRRLYQRCFLQVAYFRLLSWIFARGWLNLLAPQLTICSRGIPSKNQLAKKDAAEN